MLYTTTSNLSGGATLTVTLNEGDSSYSAYLPPVSGGFGGQIYNKTTVAELVAEIRAEAELARFLSTENPISGNYTRDGLTRTSTLYNSVATQIPNQANSSLNTLRQQELDATPVTIATGDNEPPSTNIPPVTNDNPPTISQGEPGTDAANASTAAGEVATQEQQNAENVANETQVQTIAIEQDQFAFEARKDWRVRLSLSEDPSVNYLYKSNDPGILSPLKATDGVLFPYTPQINVTYAANYSPTEIVHSNYKQYQYSSSSVDSVTLTCDFTAQDTYEANYLLAVIHFFRSMTKMFYGQDENPRRGTPPPLCYLFGMGNYQFAAHPLAISGFTYNLPNNVDYIKTISPSVAGITLQPTTKDIDNTRASRMDGTNVAPGGIRPPANFNNYQYPGETGTVSWVPTKIQLSVTCVPMMSRNQISNNFSLKEYATGKLLNGINRRGGGMW